jgi:glucose/arabinose dehydrogenase
LLTDAKFQQDLDRPFFDAIKNGVPDSAMEAYGGGLDDEEVWALVVHIRELQSEALRAKHGSPRASAGVFRSQRHAFRIETVASERRELDTPWAIDFLPDGRMLVTNRPGSMYVIQKDLTFGPQVTELPPSVEIGQGGLMDVAIHPRYSENGWIYLALCDPAKGGSGGMTKIVRGKIDFASGGARWHGQQTIFEADAQYYSRSGVHFGSRIVFDERGHVFFAVGERGTMTRVQEPGTPYGKIMRVNEDGSIPTDNPWPRNPAWTLGHRNPQGLAFDLEGNLWDTEHGPRGGDELNLIQKGANYGWPVIAFSINYNDTPFRVPWPKAGETFTLPVLRWLPSCAPSGLDVVRGTAFPQWKGDLLAGGLAGNNLDRIRVTNGKLVEREELLHGLGRVRDVAIAGDGIVYVVLNGPDKVIRLVPAAGT